MNRLYSMAIPLIIASAGTIPTLPSSPAIPSIPTIPTLQGPATSGIVATDDGTIYFVDSFRQTVWRLQPGKALDAFVSGRNGRALAVDEEGNLYGTHEDASGRVSMWRADCHGTVEEVSQASVPQYGHPMVVDDDGETHFLPVGGMTRTSNGELLVTSGASVRRIRADGSVYTIAKGERLLKPRYSFLARLFGEVNDHLTGIAAGERGEIYVANSARNAVIRINANGSADEIVKSDGGWTPTGVATANGSLYVLEYGRGVRVRRVDSSGTHSLIAQIRPDRAVAASAVSGRALLPVTNS